jgi:hypothetical protein
VILSRDVPHPVTCIELLHQCQTFLDDASLLWLPDVIQSNVSPDAFTHFMEIPDGAELHFSPETFHDLMLLAREFEHNRLITRLIP